jgi:cytochrome c oxidase subunit 2
MVRNTLKQIARALSGLGAWAATVVFSVAHALNDLPGGPAVNQLNLTRGVTEISQGQADLHWFMLILCGVIFVAVFAVMFYSIWKHRKSVGHKAANFHESVTVEIIWTVVPFLIVILMALPATKLVVAMKDTTNSDITIKVTGMQWKWGYDYLRGEGAGIGFIAAIDPAHRALSDSGAKGAEKLDNYLLKVDHPLVVPVNKKIRLITTANDVIHAWMVPALGINQAAIPGFVRDTWFSAQKIGNYYGECSQLCGKEHSYMPIHVKVVSEQDYSAWVAQEQQKMAAKADDPSKVWALEDLLKRGEQVYAANCVACHQPNGKGLGPIKPLDGAAVVLDADKTKQILVLLNGQNNQSMPSFRALSDVDIAAVTTYTKNHWSNKTGQLVQPADVLAARK